MLDTLGLIDCAYERVMIIVVDVSSIHLSHCIYHCAVDSVLNRIQLAGNYEQRECLNTEVQTAQGCIRTPLTVAQFI